MKLGELIEYLKQAPPETVTDDGFENAHSYRGSYDCVAFEPIAGVTAADMLKTAKNALNCQYEGYKGGTYTMHAEVDCYLAFDGNTGEPLTLDRLRHMFKECLFTELAPAPRPFIATHSIWPAGSIQWALEQSGGSFVCRRSFPWEAYHPMAGQMLSGNQLNALDWEPVQK